MEIEDLTLQLRRAYRLVHGYQHAILDLSHEIATRLGLDFFRWSPAFNAPPGRPGTDVTKRWKSDLLPAYSMYLAFTSTDPIQKGSYMLILWAEADTGFSKLREDCKPREPDFTRMQPPEDCATHFRFWYSVVVDEPGPMDSQSVWEQLWRKFPNGNWPESDVVATEVEGATLECRMKTYPLSEWRSVECLERRLGELKTMIQQAI